jgi:hypothetical protein
LAKSIEKTKKSGAKNRKKKSLELDNYKLDGQTSSATGLFQSHNFFVTIVKYYLFKILKAATRPPLAERATFAFGVPSILRRARLHRITQVADASGS